MIQNIGWVCLSISQAKLARPTSTFYDETRSSFIREGHLRTAAAVSRVVTGSVQVSFLLRLFKAPPPVAKYSRSQPDRSLKQFRPGVCPGAVDRRLGEISSGRRRVSRSPRRLSRPPCWPVHGYREPRILSGRRADPPSRFSFDSPGILSAYPVGFASAARRILP